MLPLFVRSLNLLNFVFKLEHFLFVGFQLVLVVYFQLIVFFQQSVVIVLPVIEGLPGDIQ